MAQEDSSEIALQLHSHSHTHSQGNRVKAIALLFLALRRRVVPCARFQHDLRSVCR